MNRKLFSFVTLLFICNAFKLGTESTGGFQNIVVSNCTMYDTDVSGIALEIVDGGTMDQILISNFIFLVKFSVLEL